MWLKIYLRFPIRYRTSNSSAKTTELKHALKHNCTIFSASCLFHRFLLSARSGSTRYYNTSSNTISSHRASQDIVGLIHSIHSFFCQKPELISSQELGHPNPYDTLLHCGSLPCLSTLVGSVRYLIILLKYTLHYYSVEFYPTFLHC